MDAVSLVFDTIVWGTAACRLGDVRCLANTQRQTSLKLELLRF